MKLKIVAKNVQACIAPGLFVKCDECLVPLRSINDLNTYADDCGEELTFTHIPVLFRISENQFELIQNSGMWAPNLKRVPCSHIKALVISEDLDEIFAQKIRDFCFYIDSYRASLSEFEPLNFLFDKDQLYALVKELYVGDTGSLTPALIQEIYGNVARSDSTINRAKKRHGKTQPRIVCKQQKPESNIESPITIDIKTASIEKSSCSKAPSVCEGNMPNRISHGDSASEKRWDNFALSNGLVSYQQLSRRLSVHSSNYLQRLHTRLEDKTTDLTELSHKLSKVVNLEMGK